MKVYLNLLFPWNETEQKIDATGAETVEVEDNYSYMGQPPAAGDRVEWHPTCSNDAPKGSYEVVSRKLVVGPNIETHYVVKLRWMPWSDVFVMSTGEKATGGER